MGGGFRQACGTMGPQVLGVAQLTDPVAFRLFIASCHFIEPVNGDNYLGYPWEHLPSTGRSQWGRQWLGEQYVVAPERIITLFSTAKNLPV